MVVKKEEEKVPLESFPGTKKDQLQALYDQWYGCTKCDLGELRNCEGHQEIVFGQGSPEAPVLIIGEAPGEEEENTSLPFVGKSGQLLNQLIATTSGDPEVIERFNEYCGKSHGTKSQDRINEFHDWMFEWRWRDFFITNAVACRPPENATPVKTQINACWERLRNIIFIVDPLIIIAAGNSALGTVLRKASAKITAMRGKLYDVDFEGRVGPVTYPVIPIFHPSYLLRQSDFRMKGGAWEKTVEDFRKAMRVVDVLQYQHKGIQPPPRR